MHSHKTQLAETNIDLLSGSEAVFDQQLKKKNDLPVGWPLFSSPWYMMPRAQVRPRSLEENKTDLASLIRVSVIHVALWFTGVPIAYGRGSNRTNITVMSDTVSWRFTVGEMRFRSAFQRNTTGPDVNGKEERFMRIHAEYENMNPKFRPLVRPVPTSC